MIDHGMPSIIAGKIYFNDIDNNMQEKAIKIALFYYQKKSLIIKCLSFYSNRKHIA